MIVTWNSSYQVRVYIRRWYFSIASDYIWVVAISAPGHLYCPMKAISIAFGSILYFLSCIMMLYNSLIDFVKIYGLMTNYNSVKF